MTNSFIAIKGQHLNKTQEIVEAFRYVDTHQDKQFSDWQAFNTYLSEKYMKATNDDTSYKGIWTDNNWTIINDLETVDTLAEEVLLQLSATLNTDIVTFLIQTTSGSYGFTLYNQVIKRSFLVVNGNIEENLSEPLKEEQDLNITDKIFIDDILGLAHNLGIDLEGKNKNIYTVKKLAYNEEMKKELAEFEFVQQQNQQIQHKKPWWKIW